MRVKFVPIVTGTAYFNDGHAEKIDGGVIHDESDIEFSTSSGKYYYKSWPEFPETLYYDNNPVTTATLKHMFYQKEPVFENRLVYGYVEQHLVDWRIIQVDIEKIEIERQEEPNDHP